MRVLVYQQHGEFTECRYHHTPDTNKHHLYHKNKNETNHKKSHKYT